MTQCMGVQGLNVEFFDRSGLKREHLIKADMKAAAALVSSISIKMWQHDQQKNPQKVRLTHKPSNHASHQQSLGCLWSGVMIVVGNSIQHNWLMQAVTTPAGKLLLFIHHLHAHSTITTQEKALLKDMVVSGDPAIFHAQEQYEQEGTELTLASHLKRLLQTAKKHKKRESEGGRMKRSISISIPERNIQKLPGIDNRI